MDGMKFVPDRLVVGPYGQPMLESGYTEISGLRFYPDRVVVGPHGQAEIRKGNVIPSPSSAVKTSCPSRSLNPCRGFF